MKKQIVSRYKNGNYKVTILEDGTRIRESKEDEFISDFPDNMDIKITNYCESVNCAWCHENSSINGKHADLNKLLEVLSKIPAGIELACGGGNLLSHPELEWFLTKLKEQNFLPSITVNQMHVEKYFDLLERLIKNKLIYGLGISIHNESKIKELQKIASLTDNIVFHVIAGVNNINILDEIKESFTNPKVLILGYKTFGRGVKFFNDKVSSNIEIWKTSIPSYLRKQTISFDNLALDQLLIKDCLTPSEWELFYQGNDGQHSMYIDAVEQKFAQNSRSEDRVSFSEKSLLEYFKRIS